MGIQVQSTDAYGWRSGNLRHQERASMTQRKTTKMRVGGRVRWGLRSNQGPRVHGERKDHK